MNRNKKLTGFIVVIYCNQKVIQERKKITLPIQTREACPYWFKIPKIALRESIELDSIEYIIQNKILRHC